MHTTQPLLSLLNHLRLEVYCFSNLRLCKDKQKSTLYPSTTELAGHKARDFELCCGGEQLRLSFSFADSEKEEN